MPTEADRNRQELRQFQLMRAMLMEIQLQCRSALLAAADLDAALKARESDRLWYSIHGLLAAAGNLSKLLWPVRASSRARGRLLRERFAVPADSPLRLRSMRDVFEHFDEKLEDWASSSQRHNIVDQSVFSAGAIQGVDPGDYLRNLDPLLMEVSFRGKRLRLKPIVEAIVTLQDAVRRESASRIRSAAAPLGPD